MGANSENNLGNKFVYVCGRTKSPNTDCMTLKGKLISDLARHCFVRTHSSPLEDPMDAYLAIASSNTFIFTLNSQTIFDMECLNQLGVAVLLNVPIISVREVNYQLPKPLPLRFYETKFMEKRTNAGMPKKDSPQPDSSSPTLASTLISCYENTIVCCAESYATFVREILHCLSSAGSDGTLSSHSAELSTSEEEAPSPRTGNRSTPQPKTVARSIATPPRSSRKSARLGSQKSASNKQRGLENIYGVEQKLPARQQSLQNRVSQKKFDLTISSVTPSLTHTRRTEKNGGSSSAKQKTNIKSPLWRENRANNELAASIIKTKVAPAREKQRIVTNGMHLKSQIISEVAQVTSFSAQEFVTSTTSLECGLAVPITGPGGRKLRRYSSLPVVPTQYLVASDKASDSPKVLTYPPPNSNYHLAARLDSPLVLSGDDFDFDPIHISRTCTPVDTFESTSRSDSPEDSSI
eukprot:Seg320.8 transcript_id=Seg320.8/GoldUCD/mRNA.D3Y31 product="hypothetical protein" protein_id=Seg320.8/GoldUCD/D3Y31